MLAGHKDPQASDSDVARILDDTRSYIDNFLEAAATGASARGNVATMTAKYPDYGNLTTLVASAGAFATQ